MVTIDEITNRLSLDIESLLGEREIQIAELKSELKQQLEMNIKLCEEVKMLKQFDVSKVVDELSTWNMTTYDANTKVTKVNTLISKTDLLQLLSRSGNGTRN